MKRATRIILNHIYNLFHDNPKFFSIFATIVSVAGLALLISAAAGEKERHRQESIKEEKTKNGTIENIGHVKITNQEIFEINKLNTSGAILVFLGFFLQQTYNIIFRM